MINYDLEQHGSIEELEKLITGLERMLEKYRKLLADKKEEQKNKK